MTAVCGGIVLISAVALRRGDSGVTSSRFSGTASHLPRLEDLDGLDIRFLAPAAGLSFGRRAASFPFGVAERRDACGPELARRLRGEVDHDAVRVDVDCAAALVDLAAGIDGLKLDAHVYSHSLVIHFAAHPPSNVWPKGIAACSHAEWAESRALAERNVNRWDVEAIEILEARQV